MVDCTCLKCGVGFTYMHKGGRRRKYCDECRYIQPASSAYKPVQRVLLKCSWCGAEFRGTRTQRYCSQLCKHRRAWAKRRVSGAPCRVCGEPTTNPSRRADGGLPKHNDCVDDPEHGTYSAVHWHRGRGESLCDLCADFWREKCREWDAKRRADGTKKKTVVTRVCAFCTVEFETFDYRSECCSRACGLRLAHGWVPRSEPYGAELVLYGGMTSRERRRAVALDKLAVSASGVGPGRWVFIQGECVECGDYFVRERVASRFCSSRCSRRSKRNWISRADRLAIYERDGWTCQLCFEPINRGAHYLDDDSATLDHIECRSWVLIPDHSPENLQTAHRLCNSIRGDSGWTLSLSQRSLVTG